MYYKVFSNFQDYESGILNTVEEVKAFLSELSRIPKISSELEKWAVVQYNDNNRVVAITRSDEWIKNNAE